MSFKHLVHKAVKSVKKHVRNLPRSFDVRPGHGKASALNPFSHWAFNTRKIVRGTKGSTTGKVARALGQKSAKYVPYQYTLAGSSGTGYVHDARSLSQLTGGR